MSSTVAKHVPFGTILRAGNSQESLGARSEEYGGWVMTQEAMCGSARYCEAEATVPACLPLVALLPLQKLLVRTHGASNHRYQ
jgi:hypothetical protein